MGPTSVATIISISTNGYSRLGPIDIDASPADPQLGDEIEPLPSAFGRLEHGLESGFLEAGGELVLVI